jgi:type IV pilus assembly protein PilY1
VSPGARNLPGDTGTDLISGRQQVITYTVGFAGGNSPVLSNAANRAGATYFLANQADQLQTALTAAITAIRDWSPTVAAPTVPISALNRAENATDVYLAFFQPDPTQAWLGTVKKYQLSTDVTKCGPVDLCLIGQTLLTKAAPNFSPAYNIETLEVDPITNTQQSTVDASAVSFWGPTTLTDGGHADNGGTGYQLVNTAGYNPSTRAMYTFLSGASGSTDLTTNLMNESNAAITKTMLGNPGMSDAQRATLINYLRGGDPASANCSDASAGTACTAWRAWPHFDVQHSKPAVVLYDPTSSPVTEVLYYLSNDGLLHAVNTATGQELWSFLIEETYAKAATLMADNAGPQADGGDGSIAVWVDDTNADGIIQSGEHVYLYFGLRRGGRVYYALDITDRLTPKFKWKITADSGSGQLCFGTGACSSVPAFNELGQAWSTPSVVKLRNLGTGVPALIFGGGYDVQEDGVPPAASANTMGRALYVVNGNTGAVIHWWGNSGPGILLTGSMNYAIPSDVAALNTDLDAQGYVDRVYVGDMGGQVWRFDIDDASTAVWRGGLLADLSNAAGQRRKIFFPPSAAHQAIQGGSVRFDAVYVGTGDREHPRLTSTTVPPTVADKMFMIMDRDQGLMQSGGTPASYATGDFLQLANSTLTGVDPAALATKKGWYRDLDDGEKIINAPTIFLQRLQFGTYAPLSQINACTPPGEGRLNEIDGLLGALLPINGTSVSSPQDRYYASFLSRGLLSTTQLVVIGKGVYTLTCADGICQGKRVYTIGDAAKIYWYMEPEQ